MKEADATLITCRGWRYASSARHRAAYDRMFRQLEAARTVHAGRMDAALYRLTWGDDRWIVAIGADWPPGVLDSMAAAAAEAPVDVPLDLRATLIQRHEQLRQARPGDATSVDIWRRAP
jgi:hypothetical protein